MEGSPSSTPVAPSPKPTGPDEPPVSGVATQDDLKSLRRWALVAGVWAVAATAVALIALLDTSRNDAEKKADATADRVTEVEGDVRELRGLSKRLDDVESRLAGVAAAGDLNKLQSRVGRAEEDAATATDRVSSASDTVKDLEDRVQTLEDAPSSGGSGAAPDDEKP